MMILDELPIQPCDLRLPINFEGGAGSMNEQPRVSLVTLDRMLYYGTLEQTRMDTEQEGVTLTRETAASSGQRHSCIVE